jgi:hypothetical protein
MLENFKHLLDPIVTKFVEIKLPSHQVRKRLKQKTKHSIKKLPTITDSIETPTISESTNSVGSAPSSSGTPLLRSFSNDSLQLKNDKGFNDSLLTTSNTSNDGEAEEKVIINIESIESTPMISAHVQHSIFSHSSERYLLNTEADKLKPSFQEQDVNFDKKVQIAEIQTQIVSKFQ